MSRPVSAVRHATSGSCRDAALAPAPLVALKHAVLRFSSQRVMPNTGLAVASGSIGGFSLGSLGAASLSRRSVGNGFFPGMFSVVAVFVFVEVGRSLEAREHSPLVAAHWA